MTMPSRPACAGDNFPRLDELPGDLVERVQSCRARDAAGRLRPRFTAKIQPIVVLIIEILERAPEDLFTIRQVYYQLVSPDYLIKSEESYQKTSDLLTKMRKVDLVDWRKIVDESRRRIGDFGDHGKVDADPWRIAESQIREALQPRPYKVGTWYDQPKYVEVWTEKDALSRVLEPVRAQWEVQLVVARGYSSYSYIQEAKERFRERLRDGHQPVVLSLGDLDPSGWGAYQALRDEFEPLGVEVYRPTLTLDQTDQLVSHAINRNDPRYDEFVETFPELSDEAYELDALAPAHLKRILDDAIAEHFDEGVAEAVRAEHERWMDQYRQVLADLAPRQG